MQTIKVNYQSTSDVEQAKLWLSELESYEQIGADFESAIRYTDEECEQFKSTYENELLPKLVRMDARSKYRATALDHISHIDITHFQAAWTESDSYVFILDSYEITELVLHWLITTKVKQIWHNASYDFRLIYGLTGEFPKNYEDTQIYAKTLLNHVEIQKARTGLKELAGHAYGSWGISEDCFTKSQMYDDHVLKYAATDPCATLYLWNRILEDVDDADETFPSTMSDHSPWDLLPQPEPRITEYSDSYFYHNVAKFLIKDFVRIMDNGLHIDLTKVEDLETELSQILDDVANKLASNPLINEFQELQHKRIVKDYIADRKSKLRSPDYYIKPFKHNDMVHRSYFMHIYSQQQNITPPSSLLPTGVPKWEAKLVKRLSEQYPLLRKLVDGTISPTHPIAVEAIHLMAQHKADIYNEKFQSQIQSPNIDVPAFNCGSSKQKQELFKWLNIEPLAYSKDTGEPSWGRGQIEELLQVVNNLITD